MKWLQGTGRARTAPISIVLTLSGDGIKAQLGR